MTTQNHEECVRAESIRRTVQIGGATVNILESVDLTVNAGESLAVMGPSGSGKSTLLHVLGTLTSPESGQVWLQGIDPYTMRREELAAFRNDRIGFIFQEHYLMPQCSALENVLVPSLVHKDRGERAEARARELLEEVGLGDRQNSMPSELSGGERQRVAIARALVNRPAILLCDEPTGNLDRHTGEMVGTCFLNLSRREGVALVVVTHDPEFARRFDRVRELRDGQLTDMT